MSEIHFKDKPTPEQIERYEAAVKYYLQHQKAAVKVLLHETPLRIESYLNSDHTDTTYHWIAGYEIKTPLVTFVVENLPREGIDDASLTDSHLWEDAVYIQDQIYRKLGKQPSPPQNNDDVYWKLWDLRK